MEFDSVFVTKGGWHIMLLDIRQTSEPFQNIHRGMEDLFVATVFGSTVFRHTAQT